ncbi:MAG: hypothetical protein Q8L23_06060 [Caulobacter sp.]|nr:hypothetical protein [Caulobacter sp.]
MPMLALVLALALCQQAPPVEPAANPVEEEDWGIAAYLAQQPAPVINDEQREALNRAAIARAAAAGQESRGDAPPGSLADALRRRPQAGNTGELSIDLPPPPKPGENPNCRELTGGGGRVCGTNEAQRRRAEELLRPPD